MTKQDLIAKATEEAGITKVATEKALKSVLGGIEKALKKG